MKAGAIIAEYNPFHNGHKYQLETFRKKQNLDYIIVLMSGNFTQRGEPAWMPKHLRAKAALLGGADLVLELPVCYATGSASIFAEGAIAHLNALNCVDFLCFGCETDTDESIHLQKLENAAGILIDEPAVFKNLLSEASKKGAAYPAAREYALSHFIDTSLLSEPNNILALEYITALKKTGSSIQPVPLARKGQDYHGHGPSGDFPSATSLRQKLNQFFPHSGCRGIPDTSISVIKNGWNRTLPVDMDDFSALFAAAFMNANNSLTDYIDMTPEIANRMKRCFYDYKQLSSFLIDVNNRSYTYSRLCRCAAHILLNLKTPLMDEIKKEGWAFYGRILGFRQTAVPLLGYLKNLSDIPLISKMTKYNAPLSTIGRELIETDIYAADVYRTACQMKFGQTLKNEFNEPLVII